MQNNFFPMLACCGLALLTSCNDTTVEKSASHQNDTINKVVYDSAKANAYGADRFGMKVYVMAFLKQGTNDSLPGAEVQQIQKMHEENIARLAEAGKLVMSGPFMDNDSIRGVFLLNVKTLKKAQALIRTDPAVQAGLLNVELRPWYGSAALMEVPRLHKSLEKAP